MDWYTDYRSALKSIHDKYTSAKLWDLGTGPYSENFVTWKKLIQVYIISITDYLQDFLFDRKWIAQSVNSSLLSRFPLRGKVLCNTSLSNYWVDFRLDRVGVMHNTPSWLLWGLSICQEEVLHETPSWLPIYGIAYMTRMESCKTSRNPTWHNPTWHHFLITQMIFFVQRMNLPFPTPNLGC